MMHRRIDSDRLDCFEGIFFARVIYYEWNVAYVSHPVWNVR